MCCTLNHSGLDAVTNAVLSLRLVFVDHVHAPCKLIYLVFCDLVNIVVANPADLNMQTWSI